MGTGVNDPGYTPLTGHVRRWLLPRLAQVNRAAVDDQHTGRVLRPAAGVEVADAIGLPHLGLMRMPASHRP